MTQEPASAARKIAAIQLLRAVAALTVAAAHTAFGFADHVGAGLGLAPAWLGEREAQSAVMLFFVVSGFVMVEAAGTRFGEPGARAEFWRRRFVRIMPPYWIASLLLAAVLAVFFDRSIAIPEFLRSLALYPAWPGNGELRPQLFLWVGWTLIYEMAFYFVFGLFLFLPRARAIMGVTAVLAATVLAGYWVPPVHPLLFALTRPLPLMFVAGMWLALWRSHGGTAPPLLRWLALLAILPAATLAPAPADPTAAGWDYLAWAGLPAAFLALAVLGGSLRVPAERFVTRAGDASFALYLLHVPMGWFWLWFWRRLPGFAPGPWDYLVTAIAASLVASWLFFRRVEQPMTRALRRWR